MKKLSKSEFIKLITTVKKNDEKNLYKWGTKAKTRALRW